MKAEEGRRLTNYWPKKDHKIGNLSCSYTYKRDDFTLNLAKEQIKYLTPYFPEGANYLNLTNSGQIALMMALFHIKSNSNRPYITSNTPVYIGTQEGARVLGVEFTEQASDNIWICSSMHSKKYEEDILETRWKTAIIDTTCWHLDEFPIENFIKKLQCETLIFVRSISKLDMEGIEYGSLGSIMVSTDQQKDLDLWKDYYKYFAAAPSIDDIPPSLFENDIYQKNIDRCEQIKNNLVTLASLIETELPQCKTVVPPHQKYFSIELPLSEDATEIQMSIIKHLTLFKVDFKSTKSFGFNYWNFDFYLMVNPEKFILRISPGSTKNPEQIKNIVKALKLSI